MALHLIQVTLGAAATQVSATRTGCVEVTIQNNSSHTCRVGDSTVSSTNGIALAASGAANSIWKWGPFDASSVDLTNFWIFGTAADVIDVTYVTP